MTDFKSDSYSALYTTILLIAGLYSAFSLVGIEVSSVAFPAVVVRSILLFVTFWGSVRRLWVTPQVHYLVGFIGGSLLTVWAGAAGADLQGIVMLMCGGGTILLMLQPIFEALGTVMRGKDKGV